MSASVRGGRSAVRVSTSLANSSNSRSAAVAVVSAALEKGSVEFKKDAVEVMPMLVEGRIVNGCLDEYVECRLLLKTDDNEKPKLLPTDRNRTERSCATRSSLSL